MIKGNMTLLWFLAGANLGWTLGGVLAAVLWGTPITTVHALTLLVGLGLTWIGWLRHKEDKLDSE
jgi:hypothetical protein